MGDKAENLLDENKTQIMLDEDKTQSMLDDDSADNSGGETQSRSASRSSSPELKVGQSHVSLASSSALDSVGGTNNRTWAVLRQRRLQNAHRR